MSCSLKNNEKSYAGPMRRYVAFFSEALTLENDQDFFYISALETYEIYYLVNGNPEHLNPRRRDYRGRKCSELLQGLDALYPFCTDYLLKPEDYHIWEYQNPIVEGEYLLKDRLVTYNGRQARMGVAFDVTDPKRKNKILLDSAQQNVFMSWLRILANSKHPSGPENYAYLISSGIHCLCLSPIFSNGSLVGVLEIANLKKGWNALLLLKMLDSSWTTAIQRKLAQEEKDTLTGHLNFEGLKQAVAAMGNQLSGRKYCLWYCNIKKFKFINAVYSYSVGDQLRKYWTDAVVKVTREGETFCRVSADNLAALRWHRDIEELKQRFEAAVQNLASFPPLAEKRFAVELVCGIYLLERSAERLRLSEMLNRASMAKKSVKALTRSQSAFYTEDMRQKELREIALTSPIPAEKFQKKFLGGQL